jgi:transcriptional regulator with XRE-family HTH domain
MTLGALIRLTREARGLTLRALEESSGVSNALISQVETGWVADISLKKAYKLSKALGISLEDMAKTKPGQSRAAKMRKLRG